MNKDNSLYVSSLERGMKIIEAFDDYPETSLSLTDLSYLTGLNKSAVQRFLYTWEALGYLKKDTSTKRYFLTQKNLRPAYNFLKSNRLVENATPLLLEARRRTNCSIYFGTLEDTNVVYLVRIPQRFLLFEATLPGRRVPAFCSSGGRAMMSCLDDDKVDEILKKSDMKPYTPFTITDPEQIVSKIEEAKEKRYSIAEQELLIGEISISAPVIDHKGRPVASVHIAAPISKYSYAKLEKDFAPVILEITQMIKAPL